MANFYPDDEEKISFLRIKSMFILRIKRLVEFQAKPAPLGITITGTLSATTVV